MSESEGYQRNNGAQCSDCAVHLPFFRRPTLNTLNQNDLAAASWIATFLGGLSLILAGLAQRNEKQAMTGMGLFAFAVAVVYKFPLLVVLIGSLPVAAAARTPAILNCQVFFPNAKLFEGQFRAIKNEVLAFVETSRDAIRPAAETFGGFNKRIGSGGTPTTKWRVQPVMVLGSFSPNASKAFPTLVALLSQCPEIVSCLVSVLEPKVRIPLHNGYTKGVVRYMLPLKVPKDQKGVYLCVNGTKYFWDEGKSILWDDTFPHQVYNGTDETRVVLYMDILRSGLPEGLQAFNNWIVGFAKARGFGEEEARANEVTVALD